MDQQKDKREIQEYKENYLLQSVFLKDTELQYIFKKTEKIVTAIYLVTNFMVSEEPLKWSLRQSTSRMLKAVMSFSQSSLANRDQLLYNFKSELLETSSLFDLSFRAGFISQMNYEILNFEISKLAANVSEYNSSENRSSKPLFTTETFKVGKIEEEGPLEEERVSYNKQDYIKDIYKRHQYKGQGGVLYDKPKEERPNKGNSERRDKIISTIKKKGDVSVKDIVKVITGYSEKTIQRELVSMVEDGILKKEGERRWSRYSLR